ncbi:hypothetical protein [Streptomyces sp. NPDC049040]|uniref:hypothetical protein n=1 Tax=Streptomyces sp. NPDC049040 TaxID=3365593 RepID=UPI003712D6DB
MTAWLVIATDEGKKAGAGYDDDVARYYSWDSTVPNSAALRPGDVIVLWDTEMLLGVSVIESIEVGEADKRTPSCPFCGKADVAARKTMTPKYRCWIPTCRREFDEPLWIDKHVTTYRDRHEAGWVGLPGVLSGGQLRTLCEKPKSQNSLRRLRWGAFQEAVAKSGRHIPLHIVDSTQDVIGGGHRTDTVRARVGGPAVRRRLLEAFGETCAFTGPVPAPALEVAQLYSYTANGKLPVGGGLLLRRDLYSLFDLGQIAVDPRGQTLDVVSDLAGFPHYAELHGRRLAISLTSDDLIGLAKHWDMHRSPR